MMDGQAVSLVRYAYRIGYRECAFFGINHPDNAQYACREVWSGAQRRMIAQALLDAQDMIEQELGYYLAPKWTIDERHFYRRPLLAHWGHIIAGGVKSDVVIQAGVAPNYAADPATVTVNGVTCAAENIHIYHAGTDIEIEPESVVIAAGVLTASIPWCRLVAPAYEDTPEDGLQYADVATWGAATVDVRCLTNDPATQAVLISPNGCTCISTPCADTEYSACIHVRLPDIGSLDVQRATYANGTWTRATLCYPVSFVELNYESGLLTLPRGAEDAIIRLAHSLLPQQVCGCDSVLALWKRDTNVPAVLTRERINASFGLSDGAWYAWQWTQTHKLRRGSVL
jgi:hypothetical protein